VIVSSRKLDGCEAVASSIRSAGGSAEAFACHIGEMGQIDAVWEHISQKHGKLDILVKQRCYQSLFWAGKKIPIWPPSIKTVDVNIRGYFFMCAKGAQLMKKHGGGAIVNVASVNGV